MPGSPFGLREGRARADQLVSLYEFLTNRRRLFLYGPIMDMVTRSDPYSATVCTDTILAMSEMSTDPIWLVIDSPGGYMDVGFGLYDVIKLSKAPIYTVGRTCYSMAAILLASGHTGHRYVFPHSEIMLHLPETAMSGDPKTLDIRNKRAQVAKKKMIDTLQEDGVKKTSKQIESDIDRERWLSATEAIEYGLADAIITPEVWYGRKGEEYV